MRGPLYTRWAATVQASTPTDTPALIVANDEGLGPFQPGRTIVVKQMMAVGLDSVENAFQVYATIPKWTGSLEYIETSVVWAGAWTVATIELNGGRPVWQWNGVLAFNRGAGTGFVMYMKATTGTINLTASGWILVWPTPTDITKPGTAR